MPVELNYMVGGEAGQGVQSVGFLMGRLFTHGGLHVFADQDYESRIRGGHNFFPREDQRQTRGRDLRGG